MASDPFATVKLVSRYQSLLRSYWLNQLDPETGRAQLAQLFEDLLAAGMEHCAEDVMDAYLELERNSES